MCTCKRVRVSVCVYVSLSACGNVCNVCTDVLKRPEEGTGSPEAEVTSCYELLVMCTKKGTWVLRENKYTFLATRPSLQPQNYICLLTNQPRKLVQKE